jgi:hypothetical protein
MTINQEHFTTYKSLSTVLRTQTTCTYGQAGEGS